MSQYLSHPEIHQQEFEPLVYFGSDRWFVMRMILTPTVGLVRWGLRRDCLTGGSLARELPPPVQELS